MSHRNTLEIPPSKYNSRYTSNASFALISIFRTRSLGVTPSLMGGSNSLLHGERQLSPSRL
jgi:hypothetical protein